MKKKLKLTLKNPGGGLNQPPQVTLMASCRKITEDGMVFKDSIGI